MPSSTGTLPGETGTAAQEAPSPPHARPRSRARRAVLAWAAIVAACVAAAALAVVVSLMAATTRTSRPRGWPPQAEEVDREAHLEGQARTYGDADMANDRQSGGTSTDDFVPGSRRMPTR